MAKIQIANEHPEMHKRAEIMSFFMPGLGVPSTLCSSNKNDNNNVTKRINRHKVTGVSFHDDFWNIKSGNMNVTGGTVIRYVTWRK